MKYKFDQILESYRNLLEQDINQPAPAVNPQVGEQPQVEAPPAPAQPQPPPASSVGFTVLTKLILDAFKTKRPIYHQDIKFSDNSARTGQEAYKYLEIVKRNLPTTTQNKLQADVNEKGGTMGGLDELNLIDGANLAIKALFHIPKLDEEDSSEYSDISMISEVTPENAREIYNKIRSYLSLTK